MKAEFEQYMHVTDRLHTNQGGPWPIESAGCEALTFDVWVVIHGERVQIGGARQAVEYNGVVRMTGESPRSFPDWDDDPRLLMIAHKAMKEIDSFTCEESDKDPSGPLHVPTIQESVAYLTANNIELPGWL